MDGALFTLLQFSTDGPPAATASDYSTFLSQNFGPQASLVEEYYPLSAFNSTPFPPFYAISTVLSYAGYICPAYRGLNTAAANGVPVWAYLWDHTPNCTWFNALPQDAVPLVGPTHTSEIPFVFGNTVNLPAPNGTCNMTQQEVAISAFLVEAWTSMAANQMPTSNATLWPEYGSAQQSLGITVVNSTIPGYINFTACALWDEIAQLQEAAYNASSNATTTPSSPTHTGGATRLASYANSLILLLSAISVYAL